MLGAFAALVAKILQAKVNGFVRGQWQVSGDNCCFEARPQKRIEDHIANTAHFPQSCQK